MPKDRFSANTNKDRVQDERAEIAFPNGIVSRKLKATVLNAEQRARIHDLLSNPALRDNAAEVLRNWQAWLVENPLRSLTPGSRRTLAALEAQAQHAKVNCLAAFGPLRFTLERDREMRARAVALREAKRPEWMSNPSALPKRPPGRS